MGDISCLNDLKPTKVVILLQQKIPSFFKHKILRYQICQLVTVVGFAWKLEGVIKVWDKSGSRKFKRTF